MDQAAAATGRDNLASALCLGCMREDTGAQICPHCGWKRGTPAGSVLHLSPGTLLRGSYLVGRVLGQGGFGITYLGWDLQLHRKVAIKEYMPQSVASRQPGSASVAPSTAHLQADYDYGLQSFMSEGRFLARFSDHPCIVSVLSLFEENRTGYMIMGYLDGVTLSQSLAANGGKLPYETAREIIMRVLDGLREVHDQGLLHRDISPDNIYLTRQGPVKILDFGAARVAAGERSQSLSVILKEGYAPEEQYRRSGNQGPWTDVYATAATLYRSITGVTPPPALDRLHGDTLKSPRELGVFIPPDAEAALMRALSVSAGSRFQSAEAFQSALAARGFHTPPTPEPSPNFQPGNAPPVPMNPPAYKLYDVVSVSLATLLGSPLAGATLMAVNYSRLKRGGEAFKVFGISVVLMGMGCFLGYFLPQVASTAIAVTLFVAMRAIAQSMQGPLVEQHIRLGGRKASRWEAVGIGVAFLALIGAVIVGGAYAVDLMSGGPKVVIGTKDRIFYTGSASKENAQALGAALQSAGYLQDRGVTVVLSKGADGTVVSFVVKPGIWDRADMVEAYEEIGRQSALSVGGFPIQVRLVNAGRETKKQLAVGRVGVGKDEIYYYGAETESEASAVGKSLKLQGFFQGRGSTVFLAKNDASPVLTFVVKDGFWENRQNVEGFKAVVRSTAPLIGGLPVELRLVDAHLQLHKAETVEPPASTPSSESPAFPNPPGSGKDSRLPQVQTRYPLSQPTVRPSSQAPAPAPSVAPVATDAIRKQVETEIDQAHQEYLQGRYAIALSILNRVLKANFGNLQDLKEAALKQQDVIVSECGPAKACEGKQ